MLETTQDNSLPFDFCYNGKIPETKYPISFVISFNLLLNY